MNIKELVDKISVTEYTYIAYPAMKFIVEIASPDDATVYQKTFGGVIHDHFPYEEYGYADPYSFVEEWKVLIDAGNILTYEVDDEGHVVEVLK